MKFINEMLGFAVLTGPLWLILILLPVCLWIAIKLAKRLKPGIPRTVGGVGIFLVLFTLPIGDEIVGRIYFYHLCTTEAGVRAYQTVELPKEYWDEQGNPKFLRSNGDLDKTTFGNKYSEPAAKKSYSTVLGIDEYHQRLVDNLTRQTLGEVVTFVHWGGWVYRNLNPGGPSAVRCKNLRGSEFRGDFYLRIFKRSISAGQ